MTLNLDTASIIDALAVLIWNNLELAAPIAAFVLYVGLYGVAGKRRLGADDDYWPRVRRTVLPVLDALGASAGLKATTRSRADEYLGYYEQDLTALTGDDDAIDPFERQLERMTYLRNPAAALKRSPAGWKSDGSWARRYGVMMGVGDALRALGENRQPVPVDPRWLAAILGRLLQGLGDMLALRQVHLTLYIERREADAVARIHVFAHDEPNALNPATALQHYLGVTQSARKGVRKAAADFAEAQVQIEQPKTPRR